MLIWLLGCPDAPEPTQSPVEGFGEVSVLGSCPISDGAAAGTRCQMLQVVCESLAPIVVEVETQPPMADAPEGRGSVVLGTGAGGTDSYDRSVITQLRGLGFTTVERRWQMPWEDVDSGLLKASCRYSALLSHLRTEVRGALCVTGNSAGASEIAYGLSHWDADRWIDFAVPTSGPPMGRLDLGCDPSWEPACAALLPEDVCTVGEPSCALDPTTIDGSYDGSPCADVDTALLLAESVASPEAAIRFDAGVQVILGRQDCTEAVPLGLLWVETVEAVDLTWVDAPHLLYDVEAGANAIVDALDGGCP